MEEEFYDSIIEMLGKSDSFIIDNKGILLSFTDEANFNDWLNKIGLSRKDNGKIVLSWPINITQFIQILLAGYLPEFHNWIRTLPLRMKCINFFYFLYYEKDHKEHLLLTIWKVSDNEIAFDSYGRYFNTLSAIEKMDELKIVIPQCPVQ